MLAAPVLLIPLSYKCLKNMIDQIDSKIEWLLLSVTFKANVELVFGILNIRKHFFLEFSF